jgi:PAS domain S-box-containing protein
LLARIQTLDEPVRQEVVSRIIRYDLLRKQALRTLVLSQIPGSPLKSRAEKRIRTIWEIIVIGAEGYIAHKPMITSDFYLKTGISRTTVGRCITMLKQLGVFITVQDAADKRRTLVVLSPPYQELFDLYVEECFETFNDLNFGHPEREQAKATSDPGQSEQRYRNLVDAAPDAIFVVSQEKIVFANVAAHRMFAATFTDQMLGLDVSSIIHPDSRKVTGQERQLLLNNKLVYPAIEKRALKLDGTAFHVEVTATYIDWNGIGSVQTILRDISLRKDHQENQKQTASRSGS